MELQPPSPKNPGDLNGETLPELVAVTLGNLSQELMERDRRRLNILFGPNSPMKFGEMAVAIRRDGIAALQSSAPAFESEIKEFGRNSGQSVIEDSDSLIRLKLIFDNLSLNLAKYLDDPVILRMNELVLSISRTLERKRIALENYLGK